MVDGAIPAAGIEEPGRRLTYAVGRFDAALRNELRRQLRPLNVTIAEFLTLSILRHRSGLSNAQLARRAMVTPQAMNQVLASLERKELVFRPKEPGTDVNGHHRARAVQLTDSGEHHADRCEQIVTALEDAAFQHVAPTDRPALAALLRTATEHLRANAGGASGQDA